MTGAIEGIWGSGLGSIGWFVWAMLVAFAAAAILSLASARRRSGNAMNARRRRFSTLEFTSTAFSDAGEMPREYTGEGNDHSPPLAWSRVPRGTGSLALLCEDPDAPQEEPFVHWIAYNISATTTSLPEGLKAVERLELPVRIDQGKNSFGSIGYGGPLPPVGHGWHRYLFTLYALDADLALRPGVTREEFLSAIRRHVIGRARLTGRYRREALPRAV